MSRILIDFEDAFSSSTGIPISIVNDTKSLCEAGCEIYLWISRGKDMLKIEKWIASELPQDKQKSIKIIRSRPKNMSVWLAQLLRIKIALPEVEFVYVRLFPGFLYKGYAKRIIRIDDPFFEFSWRPKYLFGILKHPKIYVAKLLRDIAFRGVCLNSYIVPNSHVTNQKLKSIYKLPNQNCIIYPPVQFAQNAMSVLQNAKARNVDNPFFLFIGGQRQRKDPARIINEWSRSTNKYSFRFCVLGQIPDSHLSEDSKIAFKEGRIETISGISSEELLHLIIKSSGVIFNSYGEGFGNPLAESLFAGRPVICNDLEVFKEVAGSYGFFYPIDSPHIALEIMQSILLSDSTFSLELIASRISYASRFTQREAITKWKELLRRV